MKDSTNHPPDAPAVEGGWCSQCGQTIDKPACGPTHALRYHETTTPPAEEPIRAEGAREKEMDEEAFQRAFEEADWGNEYGGAHDMWDSALAYARGQK